MASVKFPAKKLQKIINEKMQSKIWQYGKLDALARVEGRKI